MERSICKQMLEITSPEVQEKMSLILLMMFLAFVLILGIKLMVQAYLRDFRNILLRRRITQLKMDKMDIPFVLNLIRISSELVCQVESECDFRICAYRISDRNSYTRSRFYNKVRMLLARQPVGGFLKSVFSDVGLTGLPGLSRFTLDLGSQLVDGLLIAVMREEGEAKGKGHEEVAALCWELSKEEINNPHATGKKYLLLSSGRFLPLERLYSDIGSRCVVCLDGRAEPALLPCRHLALCPSCFPRVPSCPVCRGGILAFFNTT